jgi:hypothetical protein
VPAFRPVRFLGPPSEPDVRVRTDGRDWFRTASITDDAEFVGWSQ